MKLAKSLQAKVDRINNFFESPHGPTSMGNFHLSYQYGGVCLMQVVTESGGRRDVFGCGHISGNIMLIQLNAYIIGLSAGVSHYHELILNTLLPKA